jgi:hypothetical protein
MAAAAQEQAPILNVECVPDGEGDRFGLLCLGEVALVFDSSLVEVVDEVNPFLSTRR